MQPAFCSFLGPDPHRLLFFHCPTWERKEMWSRQTKRPSRFSSLPSSGRYALLSTPAGVPVHVLGVYPCSRQSEEEAFDLVAAVQPRALYVDLFPELLGALQRDVAEGRVSAVEGPASGAPSAPWAIAAAAPAWPAAERVPGAGWVDAAMLRTTVADNEMFALIGGELLGAYKAALRAAGALPTPLALSPRAFPLPLSHRNYEVAARPLDLTGVVVGDSSWNSTRVTALVGMPHAWTLVSAAAPEKNAADVEHTVALGPAGYFTRSEVDALRAAFRAALAKAAAKATAANHDMDADLLERETEARAAGDAAGAELLNRQAVLAQSLASASAFELQDIAAAVAAAPPVEGGGGGGTQKPPAVVAIVNLGSMGALTRNWDNARPPLEVFPPFTLAERAIGWGVGLGATGAICGGVGWGLFRAGRRFPKTTGVAAALLLGLPLALVAKTITSQEQFRYGTAVRTALATPRVVSPLAKINR